MRMLQRLHCTDKAHMHGPKQSALSSVFKNISFCVNHIAEGSKCDSQPRCVQFPLLPPKFTSDFLSRLSFLIFSHFVPPFVQHTLTWTNDNYERTNYNFDRLFSPFCMAWLSISSSKYFSGVCVGGGGMKTGEANKKLISHWFAAILSCTEVLSLQVQNQIMKFTQDAHGYVFLWWLTLVYEEKKNDSPTIHVGRLN